MPAGVRGGPPIGPIWRCSMSITRSGNGKSLGNLPDPHSRIAAQLTYWQDALAGLPERLQLPTDRAYPPVADYRGASVGVDGAAGVEEGVGGGGPRGPARQ